MAVGELSRARHGKDAVFDPLPSQCAELDGVVRALQHLDECCPRRLVFEDDLVPKV